VQSGRTFTSVVLFLGTSYLVIVTIIALSQRSLIYQPWHDDDNALIAQAETFGLLPWLDGSGQRIGWICQGKGQGSPVLIMHGNAGHALFRMYLVDCFQAASDPAAIAILEYPGYGSRPGTPGRETLVTAAVQAIELLHRQTRKPVLLVGESIGSVVAGEAAAQRPELIAGLLMLTPMNSLKDVAQHHFWFLPIGLILQDRYDLEYALRGMKVPMAVVLAEKDNIVPRLFGEKLYDSYTGPKKCWTALGSSHNEMPYHSEPEFWKQIFDFLKTAPL